MLLRRLRVVAGPYVVSVVCWRFVHCCFAAIDQQYMLLATYCVFFCVAIDQQYILFATCCGLFCVAIDQQYMLCYLLRTAFSIVCCGCLLLLLLFLVSLLLLLLLFYHTVTEGHTKG